MRNKNLSILLSTLVASTGISYANTLNSPTLLMQEGTLLDVIVPLSFPVNVNNKGSITVADNTKVINNSYGAIEISNIAITPKDSWLLSSFDKDYSGEKVGLKEFGFKLDGVDLSSLDTTTIKRQLKAGQELLLPYSANISPQKESLLGSNIADIVITLNWSNTDTGEEVVKEKVFHPELEGTWETKPNKLSAKAGSTSQVIGDKIYVIGGMSVDAPNTLKSVEVYDTTTDTFELKEPMPEYMAFPTSSLIDGKIYCLGLKEDNSSTILQVYDVEKDSWEVKSSPLQTDGLTLSSNVFGDEIYFIHIEMPEDVDDNYTCYLDSYNIKTGEWKTKESTPIGITLLPSSQIIGDKIYVIGGVEYGEGGDVIENNLLMYDISNNSWTEKAKLTESSWGALNSILVEGKIYVRGSYDFFNRYMTSNDIGVYDPITDSWELKLSTQEPKSLGTSVLVNGKIYYIGGYKLEEEEIIDTIDIYDTGWRYE